MQDCFVGIDLAIAKRKFLPVVVAVREGAVIRPLKLRSLGVAPPRGHGNAAVLDPARVGSFVEDAARYVIAVCTELGLRPRRIAIDAPSAYAIDGRRLAEQSLDKAGISCFATHSAKRFEEMMEAAAAHLENGGSHAKIPFSNMLWMIVGFAMFKRLGDFAECIEVFPQATARVLGAGSIHKSKPEGIQAQLAAAAKHTGWPTADVGVKALEGIAWGPTHDRLDAYLASWVAALNESERVGYGSPPNDVIWVPRVEAVSHEPTSG
jgi:hypothetical protein